MMQFRSEISIICEFYGDAKISNNVRANLVYQAT